MLRSLHVCAISPGQNSNKIAGDGGMKEGPHVPQGALERLELDATADTHYLMNLDVAAAHRHATCKGKDYTKTQQRRYELKQAHPRE